MPKFSFSHVQIDLVGPLPECQGFKYLMTVVDQFTRWPDAVHIKDMEAPTVAKAYTTNWVSRMGVPADMTSDRGTQFISKLWQAMSEYLGTQLHPTTAYHPQANGLVKQFHLTLKSSITARFEAARKDWTNQLPWVWGELCSQPDIVQRTLLGSYSSRPINVMIVLCIFCCP